MSSKSRRSSVDKRQPLVVRLEPDNYNVTAAFSNATHVSMNTFVNDAIAFYASSGQASANYVSPATKKTHGDELQAAVDKLSGE